MIFPAHFENKIAFNQVRDLLDSLCLSKIGKEKAKEITFSTNYYYLIEQLSQTHEFVKILEEELNFPFINSCNNLHKVKRIKIENTYIDESEVFELRNSLMSVRNILLFFKQTEREDFIYLKKLSSQNFPLEEILKEIDVLFNQFGKLKDTASPKLLEIRKGILRTRNSVFSTLMSILRQAKQNGYVEKNAEPVIREGRLVIPLNPSYKKRIKGIVHDESATGKTVFIEPSEVVEINNQLKDLEAREKKEIIYILTRLADFLRPYLTDIILAYHFFGSIDVIRAKALLALEFEAIMPTVSKEPIIAWNRAVHPFLSKTLEKQDKKIVPLDIHLDETNKILLISGPNAGGKSVCLKTVGLLQYMLQSGFLVPLHESSKMGIFEKIFLDIGDEQSIEDDLSTYSSHLNNMKFFLKNSSNKTLILIDEFGSGTEPQIGGAIAEGILKKINEKNVFGIITTHYTNLKYLAENTPGIVNGAMLYDRHSMQALFELSIGNPGSSFALEIARKIGIPEDIITYAIEKTGEKQVNSDKYLQDIVRDKRYWERKRQQVRIKEKKLNEQIETYEREFSQIKQAEKNILKEAKEEALNLINNTNAKIENTIREIKEAKAEKEKTKHLRKLLQVEKEKLVKDKTKPTDHVLSKKEEKKPLLIQKKVQQGKIGVGDTVLIKAQNKTAEVLELRGNKALVAVGVLKLNLDISEIEKTNRKHPTNSKQTVVISATTQAEIRQKKLDFKQDIDVRGLRADEALETLMYFIDDAIITEISQVRILHGTGTGALREVIRQYLATIPAVLSFSDEHIEMGGAGITLVNFQ